MKAVWISLFLFTTAVSFGQRSDTLAVIDEILSQWDNSTPGASVLVAREDRILYQKAFGMADLEHNTPNTTESVFEGGSLAKQFTATALLLLVNEGKISLDDDVRKYVPELPDYGHVIRIQHLLNHTSGLKDWGSVGGLAGWPRTTRVYTQDLAIHILCQQKTLNFVPGAEYSYSNGNYSLIVTIIERISKLPLEEFCRLRLFEPLGLTKTRWRSNFRDVIPNRSIAYMKMNGAWKQVMPFENIYGHGGILTTTGDLLKWNRQLELKQIGGEKMYPLRVKQGKLNNGGEIAYASALMIGKRNGFDEIWHSGSTAGYRAFLTYYPQKKLTIAVLSNDGNSNAVRTGLDIADVYLGKENKSKPARKFIKLSEPELKRFEGIYKSIREFDVLNLTMKDGLIVSNGYALHPVHRDTLYEGGVKWTLVKPGKILIENGTDTASYIRVPPPDANPASQKVFEGEYYSAEAEATFVVSVRENKLYVEVVPGQGYSLEPAYRDAFTSEDFDLYAFKRDKQGAVSGMEVNTGRAERIQFIKVKKIKK